MAGLDEIFAYGMRNPWRFSFDRGGTNQLWVGDVGQGAREEVDTPIQNGGNYGWPFFEGSLCTTKGQNANQCANQQAYRFPVFDYEHIGGRCSLTGGYVYRGLQNAVATGTYLYGDYCSGDIFAWIGGTSSVLLDTAMSISSFGEDEQGEVYVVDLNGSVSRIAGQADHLHVFDLTDARHLSRVRRRRNDQRYGGARMHLDREQPQSVDHHYRRQRYRHRYGHLHRGAVRRKAEEANRLDDGGRTNRDDPAVETIARQRTARQ